MPLVKATLEQSIKAILDKQATKKDKPEAARAELAKELADAIHSYVSSAQVNIGIPVQVNTSTGTGATTGTGTLS